MSFPINNEVAVGDGSIDDDGVIKGGAIGGAIGGAMGGAMGDLTDRQNEVLEIIKADQTISYRAIAEKLNINESAVLKHIEILKNKGYISRIGGTRGHWQIIK